MASDVGGIAVGNNAGFDIIKIWARAGFSGFVDWTSSPDCNPDSALAC